MCRLVKFKTRTKTDAYYIVSFLNNYKTVLVHFENACLVETENFCCFIVVEIDMTKKCM